MLPGRTRAASCDLDVALARRDRVGQVLNGIQAHMDMFISLAAAAGVPDVNERVMKQKKQYVDGSRREVRAAAQAAMDPS
jgi:hypothetical protein